MYDGLMEAVEYIWVNMWITSTKPQSERGASLEESFHLCGHARKSWTYLAPLFSWLTSETKRWNLGLILRHQPLNKTRHLPHSCFITHPPFPPCFLTTLPPCHLTTLPLCYLTTLLPFPPSHLTTLQLTNKTLQNNNIRPSVSPHIVLNRSFTIT